MKKNSKKFTVPNSFKKPKTVFDPSNSMVLPFPDGGKITVAPLSQNMNIAATRNQEVVGKDYLGNPLYNYSNQFDPSLKVGIEKFNILPGLGKKFVPLYGGVNVNVPYSDPSKAGVMGTVGFSGEGVGRHRTPVYGYGELQGGYSGDRGAEAGAKFGADIFLSRTPLNPKIYANDTYPRQTLVGKVSPHLRAGVVSGGNKDLTNNFTWAYGAQGELKYRFPKFPGVPYAKAFIDFDPAAGTENTKTQGNVGTVGNVEVLNEQNKSTLGFSPLVGGEIGMRFPINTYKNPAKEKAQAKAREFEEAEKARIKRELELKRYQQESQDSGGAGQVRTAKEILAMQATPQLWWESLTGKAEGPAQEELRNVRGFTPTADFANGGYMAPILPSPMKNPDTPIFRDTTALPFAYGGNMYPDGGPMEKGAVENQAADFLTKMANSPLFTSRYNTMMKKEASPEEVNAFRQHMVNNINSVDYWPVGYEYNGKPWSDETGVASYQPAMYSLAGNYNLLDISDEVNNPSRYSQGTYHPHTIFRKDASPTSTVHELSHASTVSDFIPAKVWVPYSKDPAKAESVAKFSRLAYNRSTEHKAYLDEVRKYLYDNKIYDATTKAFDETDYNNLLKTYENLKLESEKNPDNLELKYLLGAFNKSILPYDKEQNIQLFNSYVNNSSEKSELGNVNIAAYGGTLYSNGGMLKRADGSYSKRGLWDNIRANAGSGKAPTKEMLKQEKKIKSKQYPDGGYINNSGPISNLETSSVLSNSEMKSRMATAAALGNRGAQRMTSVSPDTYTFTGNEVDNYGPAGVPEGGVGTHFMTSMGDYAVPLLQQGTNGLYFNNKISTKDNEAIKFNSPEEAQYFSENYKNVAPMMWSNNFSYGGSLEGSRKTNLPEDNFMKGGRNIYDSVYASSLGDYYDQGGYLDKQSLIQNTNSGVLTASELASHLNRLV